MQVERAARAVFLKDGRLRPVLRALIYIVATLACSALLVFVVAQIAGIGLPGPQGATSPPRAFLFISELSLSIVVVGVALLMRTYLDRRSIASLGLVLRGSWLKLFAIGALLGAGMLCLVFAIDEVLGYSHVTAVTSIARDAPELLEYVPLFVLVAVAEEMSMRGYLFQNLWEEWGVVAAVALTSALFAWAHLGNPNSHAQVALTVAGLLAYAVWACLSVIWTKSLWLAIGVHFAWNLFEGPVFGFPVSGISFGTPAVVQSVAGPAWFTGGPFGPESGASSLVALAIGLALLYWMHRGGALADRPGASETYAAGANEKR